MLTPTSLSSSAEGRPADARSPTPERVAVAALLSVFAVLTARTAWVCDDAFITFRTVDNFLHGHGLRWNVAERVQTYTHPLWLLLVSGVARLTGEIPVTALAVSIALAVASVATFRLLPRRELTAFALFAGALSLSKAFVEFSASGLANPLSHLLVGAFLVSLTRAPSPRSAGVSALLAGLALVNRVDLLMVLLPPLAWRFVTLRGARARALGWMALGLLPVLAWELFSLVYYGFLLPNTAYAKLAADIPRVEYVQRGVRYLMWTARIDPVTAVVLIAGTLAGLVSRDGRRIALAAAVALDLAYVVWIGGDFMVGRFLSVPLFVSAWLLAEGAGTRSPRVLVPLAACLALLGLSTESGPLRSGADFGLHATSADSVESSGIADERRYYYQGTGLLSWGGLRAFPSELDAPRDRRESGTVEVAAAVGARGFIAGPDVHLVDTLGLCDPLLARIPRIVLDWHDGGRTTWRIGHLRRALPEGYVETLESGESQLADAGLALYYEKLCLVTRGPLFSARRWSEILAFLTGSNDHLLTAYLSAASP